MDFPPFVNVTEEFLNGYQVGLWRYRLDDGRRPLTETCVAATLQQMLTDGQYSEQLRAGMLAGWFAGVFGQTVPATTTPAITTDRAFCSVAGETHHHQPATWVGKAHHMAPLREEHILSQEQQPLEREKKHENHDTIH